MTVACIQYLGSPADEKARVPGNQTNSGRSLEYQCQFCMQLCEAILPVTVAASASLLESKNGQFSLCSTYAKRFPLPQ